MPRRFVLAFLFAVALSLRASGALADPPKLEVHEPELTNTTVALGTDDDGS